MTSTRKKSLKAEPNKAMSDDGTIQVSRTRSRLGKKFEESDKIKQIKIRPFATQTATVSVKRGCTLKTGDFENVRLDVFIALPCYVEEVGEVYEHVSNLTHELLNKEIEALGELMEE